ncbi:MAG: hypothetical protein HQM15_08670 [Deltaproteobacteria bacterium]|nr:hypothetical protein [Deltaproteobacteria bacterium]
MFSSITNVIRQTQDFWADHHSVTQAYNEAIDQAAGLVDTRLNENHSSSATRALVGVSLGAARVLGAIPLGINQWALDTVSATVSHGVLGPLYGIGTFVSTPVKGMLDGVGLVGRNLWSWANGSLSHKGAQAAADEVTTTLLTAALLVMGGRSMIKGGGEVANAVRNAEAVQIPVPQWMQDLAQGGRFAEALAVDTVSIRVPTRAAVANAGGPLGAGIMMANGPQTPEEWDRYFTDRRHTLPEPQRIRLEQITGRIKQSMVTFLKSVLRNGLSGLIGDAEATEGIVALLGDDNVSEIPFSDSKGTPMQVTIQRTTGDLKIPVVFRLEINPKTKIPVD